MHCSTVSQSLMKSLEGALAATRQSQPLALGILIGLVANDEQTTVAHDDGLG